MALDYLPSPGWAVVYGETPSADRWSELGENDDALATGAGIDDDAIKGRHIDFSSLDAQTDYDTGWIAPTFAGGWGNGVSPVAYRKKANVIYLRGQPTKSPLDGTTILTLPVGFRPNVQRIWTCPGSSLNYGKIVINADGTMAMAAVPSGGSYLGLDAISFPLG